MLGLVHLGIRAEGAVCKTEPGSTCTCYEAQALDFHPVTSGVRTSTIDAANLAAFSTAANAISSTVGVQWSVTQNSASVPSTDVDGAASTARDNGISELVEVVSDAAWLALGFPDNAIAQTVPQINELTCTIRSADIYYKHVPPLPWNTSATPGEIAPATFGGWQPSELSFKQVMAHELVHAAGLGHEDTRVALMNTLYPNGGDPGLGGIVRVNADEQLTLSTTYAGGSSGPSFLLYAFERISINEPPLIPNPAIPGQYLDGKSLEIWNQYAATHHHPWWSDEAWVGCNGCTLSPTTTLPPSPAYVAIHSDTGQSVHVKYGLATSDAPGSCTTAIEVAHSDLNMVPGVAQYAFPSADIADEYTGVSTLQANSWCIPTSTPGGNYFVCADITNNDDSAFDDEVFSDKAYPVVPICGNPALFGCDGVHMPACP